jgi:hypothetical protein
MEREFAHFISGRGRFVPDGGVPFEICAGDAVWFPAYTTGTWEITETLRKTYVIVGSGPVETFQHSVMKRLEAVGKSLRALIKPGSNNPGSAKIG